MATITLTNARLVESRVFSQEEIVMADREYDVARIHEGDKLYKEGDVRVLNEAEAKHLVDLGVLVPRQDRDPDTAPAEKAEPAPENKAEPAPANKADKPRQGKGK